ncbi:hypothetical protein E2C01_097864 [Portunus trituberculatus]|uniref:Uncharacterized protein n=1 Tax=Portunus trituberculatus TaxID=210409 RepID=A0A5B7KB69_PORTR|nr:hypothetical protein [Portunus trituberculatus]
MMRDGETTLSAPPTINITGPSVHSLITLLPPQHLHLSSMPSSQLDQWHILAWSQSIILDPLGSKSFPLFLLPFSFCATSVPRLSRLALRCMKQTVW